MSELVRTKAALDQIQEEIDSTQDEVRKADLTRIWWRLKSSYDYCVFVYQQMYGETLKKEIG